MSLARDGNDILYGGYSGWGVYRSVDNGDNWTVVGQSSVFVANSIVVTGIDTLVVGAANGILRSTNAGNVWTTTGLSGQQIYSLAVGTNRDLWAGIYAGIYYSNSLGASWSAADAGFFSDKGVVFSIAPWTRDTVFAGTTMGVYRTSNRGVTWTPVNNGIFGTPIFALAVDSTGVVYAGSVGGSIFRSVNFGASWIEVASLGTRVNLIYVDGSEGSIFAGTDLGPYVSANGTSWSEFFQGSGMIATSVSALFINEFDSVFAGCANSGIHFSGWSNHWESRNNGFYTMPVYDLVGRRDSLFAATSDNGVYRSLDNGSSWSPTNMGLLDNFIPALAYSPAGGILAGTYNHGVFRSINYGGSWVQTDLDSGYVSDIIAVASGALFAGTGKPYSAAAMGVYRSTDGGNTWQQVGLGDRYVSTLAVDSVAGYMYAVTDPGSVWRGDIQGLNWTHMADPPGLPSPGNTPLLVDPRGILYIGTSDGTYFSGDNGVSWYPLTTGFVTPIFALAMNSNGDIYAGSGGNGVYWSQLAGACPDTDGDWVCAASDNCPSVFNPDQADADLDGVGDVCAPPPDTVEFAVIQGEAADLYYSAVCDLDRDNYPDVVYSDPARNGVFVAYGRSSGGLEPPVVLMTISQATIAIDYIDGDTLPDIAIATATTLDVLLNHGGRSYGASHQIQLSGRGESATVGPDAVVSSIASGYFNDDEFLDVVVAPNSIYVGAGDGSFGGPTVLPFQFESVNVGDFNSDGRDDLVTLSGMQLTTYVNTGGIIPSFAESASTPVAATDLQMPLSHVVTDFDQDGAVDFTLVTPLLSPAGQSAITVVFGNGMGGVRSMVSIPVMGVAYELVSSDPNRDGHLDIIVANGTVGRLELYFGDGLGNFGDPEYVPIAPGVDLTYVLSTLDLNRDGNPDFVAGASTGGNMQLAYNQNAADPVIQDVNYFPMVTTGYSNVNVKVINPAGFVISRNAQTVAGSDYWRVDANKDGLVDEQAVDYNVQPGEYAIIPTLDPSAGSGAVVSTVIGIDGSQQRTIFLNYDVSGSPKLSAGTENLPLAATDSSLLFYYTVYGPGQSEPISPPNGAPVRDRQPTISWNGLAGGTDPRYGFQLNTRVDLSGTMLANVDSLAASEYHVETALEMDSVYYWRVLFDRDNMNGYEEVSRTYALYIVGCCVDKVGNANLSGNGSPASEEPTIADVSVLIDAKFLTGTCDGVLPCLTEADINQTGGLNPACDDITISDISVLIDYLFLTGPSLGLAPCPETTQ